MQLYFDYKYFNGLGTRCSLTWVGTNELLASKWEILCLFSTICWATYYGMGMLWHRSQKSDLNNNGLTATKEKFKIQPLLKKGTPYLPEEKVLNNITICNMLHFYNEIWHIENYFISAKRFSKAPIQSFYFPRKMIIELWKISNACWAPEISGNRCLSIRRT